jgi:hypothetical protein
MLGSIPRMMTVWWAHQDLNLEPTDYESAALTVELWALRSTRPIVIQGLACVSQDLTHFTPSHSSWLNQVERGFALLSQRQIKRGSPLQRA